MKVLAEIKRMYLDEKKEVLHLDDEDFLLRNRERRRTLFELIDKGKLNSGLDYHYAGYIFQHGESSDDYKLAHDLVSKAMELGDESAKWLYAASLDRWLLSCGAAQLYGTQFIKEKDGEWKLAKPIDNDVSDEERLVYGVPPVGKALKIFLEKCRDD